MPAGAACGKGKRPDYLVCPFLWLHLDQAHPFHQTHKGGNIGYDSTTTGTKLRQILPGKQ